MASELVVHDGTVAMQVFGDDYAAIKNGIAQNLTDTELDYLASVSRSMGLSVLRKQIYGTKRKSKVNGQWVESVVIQVGIDGYRVIAERTGRYGGQLGPLWCGADGEWRDVWLSSEPPAAAKVGVLRTDFKEPLWAVATYTSYAAMYENRPQGLWAKMPEVMLAKCAESLALRKAFPDQMAGTYTEDEMGQADNPAPTPPREIKQPSRPIEAPRAPSLSEPRKGLSDRDRLNRKLWATAIEYYGDGITDSQERRDKAKTSLHEWVKVQYPDATSDGEPSVAALSDAQVQEMIDALEQGVEDESAPTQAHLESVRDETAVKGLDER